MTRWTIVALLALGALTAQASAEDLPYPAGTSTQDIEGLATTLVLPREIDPAQAASLVVVLHGAGGTATGMAGSFAAWADDGYVVCAPKSVDVTWEPADLDKVRRIVAHLKEGLPIDPKKLHVVGFSNGGWNLAPLAFDDDIHPCSATWIAAGYNGGQVPKWAKTDLGAIALAGSEDPNLAAARATVRLLEDKVRNVEVRVQPGLDHAFPRDLVPYLQWWMGVQEGRFKPGDDRSFDWTSDLEAAQARVAGQKKGGVMLWVYETEGGNEKDQRLLQLETFFDPEVRFLGSQLACVRLEAAEASERLASLGVKELPAVVVLDTKGKAKKVHGGAIKASKLAKTLRGVAPQRKMPED